MVKMKAMGGWICYVHIENSLSACHNSVEDLRHKSPGRKDWGWRKGKETFDTLFLAMASWNGHNTFQGSEIASAWKLFPKKPSYGLYQGVLQSMPSNSNSLRVHFFTSVFISPCFSSWMQGIKWSHGNRSLFTAAILKLTEEWVGILGSVDVKNQWTKLLLLQCIIAIVIIS